METHKSSPQLQLECVEILSSDHPGCYSEERVYMIYKTRVLKFKKGDRFVFLQSIIKLYVCMCLCKGWAIKSGLCTATFNDLLCYPFGLVLY
jgi:hypothetical protein